MIPTSKANPELWKWSVCGMLLLATMLNYMDRQTLSVTASRIMRELGIDERQYGALERDFGYAFAVGGLFFGFLADRVRIYFLYPLLILLWSITGFAAAYAVEIGAWLGGETLSDQAYMGFHLCRTVLGFFEAAQWPFALVTTSRMLSPAERTLGNSILQSGTAIGSIFTPIVVQSLVTAELGTWRWPFMVIGVVGIGWIVPWFVLMKPSDLSRHAEIVAASAGGATASKTLPPDVFWRRFIVCAVMVVVINLAWHFYRVWLPLFLERGREYSETTSRYFNAGYFVAADVGCLGIGFIALKLVHRGWGVHTSRTLLYGLCALTVALGAVAALQPAGPLLLCLLLLVGAAGLGLFPIYYAFSQDLSGKHQGKISGTLGFTTWMVAGSMQGMVGSHIKETQSYTEPMILLSLAPLVALVLLVVVWKQWPPKQEKPVV